MKTIRKTRISAILPSALTKELRRAAEHERIPQSRIIEHALRLWLRKKLDADTKKLARIKFDDLPTEEEWFSIQSKVE